MIYFTKAKIENHNSTSIEEKIRSRTINKGSGLDLASPVLNIGSKKLFFGYQEEGDVEIVRTRSSLERFLPKIIVGFLDGDFCTYKIRLGILPFLIGIGLGFSVIGNLIDFRSIEDLLAALFLPVVFIGLVCLEIFITKKRIKKAVTEMPEKELI